MVVPFPWCHRVIVVSGAVWTAVEIAAAHTLVSGVQSHLPQLQKWVL